MNDPRSGRRKWVRAVLAVVTLSIVAFWVWALFFPPTKQSVAKVSDDQWSARAEEICHEANLERDQLADLRRVDEAGVDALAERADLIDQATDIVERMVTDVMAEPLATVEDRQIAKRWQDMYTTLIADRRLYTVGVRGGENGAFAESAIDGMPISDFINDFTVANRMKSCSAPLDLAV